MGPQKLGYDIIGREGLALSAKWGVEGPKTYEGYCSQGFPNLFMQNAPQGTFTSVPYFCGSSPHSRASTAVFSRRACAGSVQDQLRAAAR